jgi:hypothetical protein
MMRKLLCCALVMAAPSLYAAPIAHWESGAAGFIDDAFAVSDDGKTVAFITTDGASAATLHVAVVGGAETKIDGAPLDTTMLELLGADRVLVVHGSELSFTADVFGLHGPEKAKIGPFNRLAIAKLDGKRVIVTFTRSEKKSVQYDVVAYDLDRLRPIKRKSLTEDAEGQIHIVHGVLKPLWWSDGFSVINARKPGEYDKAHDIRQPDRFNRYDVFAGKVVDDEPVRDIIAFTRIGLLRRDHPNESVIVHFADDRKQLLMLDRLVEHELQLQRPIWKYDPQTLESQLLDERQVAFSLTVDPVNPDAVNRQKTEPDEIDLYVVDRQSQSSKRILTLPGEGRRSSWRIAGKRFVLLRKGKGFDRGGVVLEAYDLDGDGESNRDERSK